MRCRPVFLLVLLAVLTSSFRSAGAETFRNPMRIPTTSDPGAFLTGDVNGDGVPDILWLDVYVRPYVLHLLLGQHDGSYLPGPDLVLAPNSTGCRMFDSDLDGKLDLICASGTTVENASILIYLGRGDATFAAPRTVPLPPANATVVYPLISPPVDINGDGLPDLIISGSGNTYVLLGDAAAGYRPVHTILPPGFLPTAVVDVNGDGKTDLLYSPDLGVSLGNGDGTFRSVQYLPPLPNVGVACAFHDMDGDGHPDAVCGSFGGVPSNIDNKTHLIVLHGKPDGTFDPNPISDRIFGDTDAGYNGFNSFGFPIFVKDLNGDGIPDVIADAGDGFTVILGGPHLTFSDPKHYAVGIYGSVIFFRASYADQIVDLNGDGALDVVASGDNTIFITHGRPDGTFDTAPILEVASIVLSTTVADFNGDGIPDLVAGGDASVRLNLGRGDGTFLPFTSIRGTDVGALGSGIATNVAHGDFNGDGKQDILAFGFIGIAPLSTYSTLFGHGDGTFDPPVPAPQTSFVFPAFSNASDDNIADINGDGRSDIFVTDNSVFASSGSNRIDVGLSNGDGSFRLVSSPVPTEAQDYIFNYRNTSPTLADFDGDGKLDAAFGAYSNAYVLRGHGDGSFEATGTVLPIPPLTQGSHLGAYAVAAGDFDGDGNQDLAVLAPYGFQESAVFVYYGAGDGTFSAPVTAATFNRAYGNVHAADLNQDGRSDLILDQAGPYAAGKSYFGIVHALPGRTFGPEVNYTIGPGLSNLAVADMNRDGLPDLVIGNGVSSVHNGSATVLLNLGNTPAVTGALYATPEPSAVGQSFTLTASLTPPAAAALAGSVAFTVDGAPAGSAALSGNAASISVPGDVSIGSHTLGAVWPGDTTYPALTLTGRHVVTGLASTTSIIAVPNPSLAGGLVTFNIAVVASTGGPAVPTGSITLTDGQTTLATLPLDAGAVRPFSTKNLSIGSHTIIATYGGDSLFASSSASVVEVVKGVATASTLSAAPNPASVGQTVNLSAVAANAPTTAQITSTGALLGAFTFTDGASILGVVPIDGAGRATLSVAFSSVGPHSLTAVYSGDATHLASSATSVEQIVASSVIALSANPNPAYQGASVVFSANVLAQGGTSGANLSGTVQFLDGSTLLGTVPLSGSAAVFTTNRLSVGQHSITAVYSGAGTLVGSTSAPLTETILLSDFAISSTPATLSLRTGHHLTFTVTATSMGAFADTLNLSVQALPVHTSTSFPRGSGLPLAAGASASAPVYLDTDDVIGYLGRAETPDRGPRHPQTSGSAFYAAVPAGLLALLGLLRRKKQLPFLLAALGVLLLGSASGCSGKYPSSTAPGSYILRVSATGASTGATHTVDIPLLVSE